MKATKIVACLAIIAAFGTESLHAQAADAPAEFPPASYKSTQYVDSKGCVFIRAGIDGNVSWIPRVSRQRRQICGQTPSLSGDALAQASSRPVGTQPPAPVQLTIDPPAPSPADATAGAAPVVVTTRSPAAAPAPQRRPAPVRTAQAAPSPAPEPTVFSTRKPAAPAAAPQPTRRTTVRAPQAAPSPAPEPTVFTTRRSAAAATTSAPRTIRRSNGRTTRAAPSGAPAPTVFTTRRATPEAAAPAPTVRRVPVTRTATVRRVPAQTPPRQVATRTNPQTRVLPSQVFDDRAQEIGANRVPEGFRPAWEDDRLNPRRAEQNLEGVARTRLVWTQSVPRRLIERSTGRDVTNTVALVYPYTDQAVQERDLGTVTLVQRDGQLLKRVVRNTRSKARAPVVTPRPSTVAAPKVVRKTAPTAPRAQPKAVQRPTTSAQKGRYVQVGTFGVPSNAQATARRLQAAGLPARIGTLSRGGKSYQVVMAGPFNSSNALTHGLRSARSMGFGDAFVR